MRIKEEERYQFNVNGLLLTEVKLHALPNFASDTPHYNIEWPIRQGTAGSKVFIGL